MLGSPISELQALFAKQGIQCIEFASCQQLNLFITKPRLLHTSPRTSHILNVVYCQALKLYKDALQDPMSHVCAASTGSGGLGLTNKKRHYTRRTSALELAQVLHLVWYSLAKSSKCFGQNGTTAAKVTLAKAKRRGQMFALTND